MLVLLMIVSVVSCGNADTPDTQTGNADTTDAVSAEETTEETKESEPYTGVFKAGFGRVDISPTVPFNGFTTVLDPIYTTCVAVFDGKNTALIFTVDVKNIGRDYCEASKKRINSATGVPVTNIIISATHNHSMIGVGDSSDTATTRWNGALHNNMIKAAKEAIADLSDAEVHVGTGKTTGLAFVRRYIHEDGSFSGINMIKRSSTPVVKYESEADDSLGLIRFVRADKKDIVMANWQAHLAHAVGVNPQAITADLAHHARKTVEGGDDDVLLAYYQGASGNINLTVKVPKSGKYDGNYIRVGEELGKIILNTLKDGMSKVEAGTIYTRKENCEMPYRTVDPDRLAKAKEVVAAGAAGSTAYNSLLEKYGFQSNYEVERLITLEPHQGEISTQIIGGVAFGDIAFVAVPYEMFDTNGMEVKNGSPYKKTFVITCAGGGVGYVPSALAVKNGGYEVVATNFEFGTAEKVVGQLLEMLNKLNEKK